ncbi:OsmC family protein [Thermococcus sp.]|uniref:OsmC family protein n=1 Tax=Thermococcus sp. TaxID=35749 RepID=UPI002608DE51|nr:OsmC family protein [Thermococcus sp.]
MERLKCRSRLRWDGNVGSFVKMRDFGIRIDTETDGHNEGPNPTEVLLSAIGGYLMVNWGRLVRKMRLNVEGIEIEVTGWRGPDEPALKEITYHVRVKTIESEKKMMRAKTLAEKYGTVFNTVGTWKIKGSVEIARD